MGTRTRHTHTHTTTTGGPPHAGHRKLRSRQPPRDSPAERGSDTSRQRRGGGGGDGGHPGSDRGPAGSTPCHATRGPSSRRAPPPARERLAGGGGWGERICCHLPPPRAWGEGGRSEGARGPLLTPGVGSQERLNGARPASPRLSRATAPALTQVVPPQQAGLLQPQAPLPHVPQQVGAVPAGHGPPPTGRGGREGCRALRWYRPPRAITMETDRPARPRARAALACPSVRPPRAEAPTRRERRRDRRRLRAPPPCMAPRPRGAPPPPPRGRGRGGGRSAPRLRASRASWEGRAEGARPAPKGEGASWKRRVSSTRSSSPAEPALEPSDEATRRPSWVWACGHGSGVSRAGHLGWESEAAPAAISEPGARALPQDGRDTASERLAPAPLARRGRATLSQ